MIIKQCYIENFGTFREAHFDFTDGINVYAEENGWGKSTLAAFIKSMFYGLEYSRKKSLTEYRKYEPWQGGKYGGYLVFSVKNKDYKVIRYFGKKSADCVFELYDLSTNKPSNDYSQNLGEELFGIDCVSFERSIFIKLDSEQGQPELSDSISAKLNNLVDNTDDINNFETAYSSLKKLAASIKTTYGSGGMVGDIDEQIREKDDLLIDCGRAEREIGILQKKISAAKEESAQLEKYEKELAAQMSDYALLDKKETYTNLLDDARKLREKAAQLTEFFKNGIPTDEEIIAHTRETNELDIHSSRTARITRIDEKRAELSETEVFFGQNFPTETELDKCRNYISEYNNAREQLAYTRPSEQEISRYGSLCQKYGDNPPDLAQVNAILTDFDRISQINLEINDKNAELSGLYAARANSGAKPNTAIIAVFAAIIALGIGAAALFSGIGAKIIGVALAIIGAAGLGICMKGKKGADNPTDTSGLENEISALREERDTIRERCAASMRAVNPDADASNIAYELNTIRADITDMKNISGKIRRYEAEKATGGVQKYKTALDSYFGRYRYSENITDYTKMLSVISDKLNAYNNLRREIDEYDTAMRAAEKIKASLMPFLAKYDAAGSTYFERVQDIRDKLLDFRGINNDLKSAEEEIKAFEDKNDIAALKNVKPPERPKAELERLLNECRLGISRCAREIALAQNDVTRQSTIADNRADYESEREHLCEEKDALIKKRDIITETMSLLEKAKDNMTSMYMKDMTGAFNKYIHMLEPKQDNIILTADLDTRILDGGRPKESGHHSRGYADMANIAIRLALAEVMYKEETPFLILDDPFVNLDDTKTERALEFLKEIGKERQIFYFVCHKSRSL